MFYLSIFLVFSFGYASHNEAKISQQKFAHINTETPIQKVFTSKVQEDRPWKISYEKKHYDFWLEYFVLGQKGRHRFQNHLINGDRLRNVVESILAIYNLPLDLYFVGLIESGYNAHIESKAKALGYWQFIKKTAKNYGLRVDEYVDERRNIVKATHGAAKYFRDLYNILGSWELALIAYNAGEYRIINAIRKGKTRDYRELVRKKLIPQETIYYIPKMMAAREIAKNRERYGFVYGNTDNDFDNIKEINVKKSFDFELAVRKSGIDIDLMKKLNPDIRSSRIKVVEGLNIIVPRDAEFLVSPSNLIRIFGPNRKKEEEILITMSLSDRL